MKKHVCIIGGGIIGISAAIQLAQSGASVSLIEKDRVGKGCSYGNAGWLTPCFAMPLPMPGMFFQSLKWLLNPESPLYIKPALSLELANWLFQFMRSMTHEKAIRSTEALVLLSKESLKIYKELNQEFPNQFGFQEKGLLMVSETQQGQRAIENELEYVSQFQVQGELLNESQVRQKEPAIVSNIVGGGYFPNEAHVEPFLLMAVLKEKALNLGVKLIEGCEVREFVSSENKITEVKTSQGPQKAEIFLLAAGSYSALLGKKMDQSLPILGGKGYSMLVDRKQSKLQYPTMVIDRKLALTPHANNIRIAGTLELVNQDYSLNERRANVLLSGAKSTLGLPLDLELNQVQDLWKGLRPCTPDGLPIIGFSKKISNLFHASGHQMLGLQAGAGTGKLIAQMIMGEKTFMDHQPFRAERFSI